jgi:very-short-patch-repair endonuclease
MGEFLFAPPCVILVAYVGQLSGTLMRWIPFVVSERPSDLRARELRLNPTPAERYAWTLLRNRGILGLKFRRQHVLHGFIVDFYCPSEGIVIELEGNVHDTEVQRDYDRARAGLLEAAGYRVIRLRNRDVSRERLETVLREALGTSSSFPLSRRERGSGGEDT